MTTPITLAITAGGRPDLLRRTLESLLPHNGQFLTHAIVSNDAGDDATTAVARELMPSASIIHHRKRAGQLATIDEIYGRITTDIVFHCEDDWFFDPLPIVPKALELLMEDEHRSCVMLRQSGDIFRQGGGGTHDFASDVNDGTRVEWAGYGFNPSLVRRAVWQTIGPLNTRYAKEADVDRAARLAGYHVRFLRPGVCYHIGDDRHVHDPVASLKIRGPLIRRVLRKLGNISRGRWNNLPSRHHSGM